MTDKVVTQTVEMINELESVVRDKSYEQKGEFLGLNFTRRHGIAGRDAPEELSHDSQKNKNANQLIKGQREAKIRLQAILEECKVKAIENLKSNKVSHADHH